MVSMAAHRYEVVLLGTLSGGATLATGINQSNAVVGFSSVGEPNQTRAFLWQAGVMRDLGTLEDASSQATAINNAGVAVG